MLLQKLCEEWVLLELKHRSSKSASNEFWALSTKLFPKLYEAKTNENINSKIPQFRSIRQKMYQDKVPKIMIEVAYEVKETGDVIILKDLEKIPVKQYPPSHFKKLYESASVNVSTF